MRESTKRILAACLTLVMLLTMVPTMALAAETDAQADVRAVPQGDTLVLNGLFDVKSLHAGDSKYLYINTYPEEGTAITAVSSSDPSVVAVSHGNNSADFAQDDTSGENAFYNFVKLEAKKAGSATVSVTVEDQAGDLGSVTKTFTVQVVAPEYEGTQRVVTDISQGWSFQLERDMASKPAAGTVPAVDASWEAVTIPHSWNDKDGADGGNNYHKGIGWYVKTFTAEELSEAVYGGKQIYLEVGAACKISEVYVNGEHLVRHEGGYSRFRVDLTDALTLGQENTVAISVDNRVNDLTPMSGDFTVFGGLYRDISLVAVGDLHMDLDQETAFGGRGLYVAQNGTQNVTKDTTVADIYGQGGKLTVTGEVKNSADAAKKASAVATVYDADWKKVAEHTFPAVEIAAGERHSFQQELVVADPHLWNGMEDPYQYNVVFALKDENGQVVDREEDRIGFRFFCADPEKGFFLNGKSYPLRGVNSHQDRYGKGCAATHQDREQDMAMMAEMGANAIRFAHYQHDPFVYELASERGITVWAEIPMVNAIVNTRDFYNSTLNNQNEMIHQGFNCASILMWGDHNEQWPNNKGITVLLDLLYKNAKKQDPSRLVTVATAQEPGDTVVDSKWDPIALSWQSDVSAWNKYFGIYQTNDARFFGTWINQVHDYGAQHKTITGTDAALTDPEGNKQEIPVYVHGNVGMSEYGADCSPYKHEERPGYKAGSQCEEFTSQWHEIYYKVIAESEWMWGSYIWNMFEFGSDSRTTTPDRLGVNTKGIVSYDRTLKKDAFYFYKANWSKTPTLQITSERFVERYQDDINVKVYANMDAVELFVDGVSVGKLEANGNSEAALNNNGQPDDTLIPNTQMGVFTWPVSIAGGGDHVVTAVGTKDGKTYVDQVTWIRKLYDTPSITSSVYSINNANLTISNVPGGTTVADMMANIKPQKNSTVEYLTADGEKITDETTIMTLGMQVKVTAEDGEHFAVYTIVASPISDGKKVTASQIQNDDAAQYGPQLTVDGNTGTRWSTNWPGVMPQWIVVDLGEVYNVTGMSALWYDYANRQYTADYETSLDGETFAAAGKDVTSPKGGWAQVDMEKAAPARYLRVTATKCTNSQGSASIYEFQAFGFALKSNAYAVDNANHVISGVAQDVTVENLLRTLSVEGEYNTLTVKRNGETVTTGPVGMDAVVAVGYGEGKEMVYTLSTTGPDSRPISQGKPATALDIEVDGKRIPNEDANDGCGTGKDNSVAALLNDGDLATRWSGALTTASHTVPATGFPAEVLIDLGAQYELNDLYVKFFQSGTKRYYKFAVYAGSTADVAELKNDANIIWDVRNNTSLEEGKHAPTGTARYILLSVTGSSTNSSYHPASVFEFQVYGYRFGNGAYTVDTEAKTVSGVAVQTKVADFLKELDLKGNYVANVVLGSKVLDDDALMTQGTALRVSSLENANPVEYAIEFVEAEKVPVSQGMPVHAHDVEIDGEMVPNEDTAKGDVATKINDGDLTNTRWVGGFNSAHNQCYYPASVTIDMTDLLNQEEFYYLTGVQIYWYGAGNRSYQYTISAKNIVGIETGFTVDASNNKDQSGFTEHWTETGLNEIKDLTLNVKSCSNTASYSAASVYELQVFAWRIKSSVYAINEVSKTIDIGDEALTVAELRSGLEILGNCDVKFVDAQGEELGWNDAFTKECKLVVTDVKDHVFTYTVAGETVPVDKTALAALVAEAEALNEDDYTAESWAALKLPLGLAKAVLASENSTQKTVDDAAKALSDAINGLVKKPVVVVDKTALEALYNQVKDTDNDDYTAESWTAFETALADAKAVLDNAEATQAEVDVAAAALTAAVEGLEKNPVVIDKTALAALVAEAEALAEDDYTAESWKALETALNTAKAVLNSENATQAMVDAVFQVLSDAMDGLEKKPEADKSDLEDLVEDMQDVENKDYTKDSWKDFQDALEQAEDVLADEDATQAEIDKALNELKDAYEALEKKKEESGWNGIVLIPGGKDFDDVDEYDWFYDAVDYVTAEGLMNGVSDDRFAPNAVLTRGMVAQILYNLEGVANTYPERFPDVTRDDWYCNAAAWASYEGIMKGYGDGRFGGNDPVTREQLAATLYRYAAYRGWLNNLSSSLTRFEDGHQTSDWAVKAMEWAVGNELMAGSNGKLDPTGTATRAQVAQVLMNFCERIA